MLKTLKVVSAIILILAVGQWPYDYYTILRVLVFFTAGFVAVKNYGNGREGTAVMFGLIALLFNPIFPIHLERGTWAIIDIGSAITFGYSAVAEDQSHTN